VHVSMIGHCDCGLAKLLCFAYALKDFYRAIENAVLSMKVQVNELRHRGIVLLL